MDAVPKVWPTIVVPVSRYMEWLENPDLTWEQRGRLAVGWAKLWSMGYACAANEDTVRRLLGYTAREWEGNRHAILRALGSDFHELPEDARPEECDGGPPPDEPWGDYTYFVGFARDAAESQAAYSAAQREHGKRKASGSPKATLRVPSGHPQASAAFLDSKDSEASRIENQNLEPLCDGEPSHEPVKSSLKRESPEVLQARKDWRESFEETFWPAYYPLRRGRPNPKAAALRSWLKVRAPSQEVFDAVMAELRACMAHWDDPQYVPHASVWLNKRIIDGVFYPSEAVHMNGKGA